MNQELRITSRAEFTSGTYGTFTVGFDRDYLETGDILSPIKFLTLQMRVVSEPKHTGPTHLYSLQLIRGSIDQIRMFGREGEPWRCVNREVGIDEPEEDHSDYLNWLVPEI